MRLTELTTSLRRPVSPRITIRRSTAVMAVLFLGLGALWLGVKPSSASPSTATNRALTQVLNGLPPGGTITLTRPGPTTTTTAPTTTTTTVAPASTTTSRPASTTTRPPRSTTTTTAPSAGAGSTTTTVGRRSTTTSSTSSTTPGPNG